MHSPSAHLSYHQQRHADVVRGMRHARVAELHPSERRQALGRLGRALFTRRARVTATPTGAEA